MKKLLLVLITTLLVVLVIAMPALAATLDAIDDITRDTAAYLVKAVPEPSLGAVGGEWLVMGLARSSASIPHDYLEGYLRRAETQLKQLKGILHERKHSEYARLALALTALGRDPTAFCGYNMLLPLADYDKTVWQGINGAIFALLALDSGNYIIPKNKQALTQATREKYVQYILSCELPSGGFNLSGTTVDPDITAMALQALAKYQEQTTVATATNRALQRLSAIQGKDGGFTSWNASNCESVAQVIVALAELGINPEDRRFIKNNKTLIDNLLTFYTKGKGFAHGKGAGTNVMASEQAFYALVSLQRFADEQNSLYRMVEEKKKDDAQVNAPTNPSIKKADII